MEIDTEIEAMGQIAKALAGLDADATRRVLKWAIERFQPRQASGTVAPAEAALQPSTLPTTSPQRTFLNLPEFFDATAAESGLDRALAVAYWFQVLQGQEGWDSQKINTELKHLGHPSSNITRDLDNLMARSPRFVMQIKKQGTTKQARKLYALTREGIRAVEAMLNRTEPLAQR